MPVYESILSLFAPLLQNGQIRGQYEKLDITTESNNNFDFFSPRKGRNLPNV